MLYQLSYSHHSGTNVIPSGRDRSQRLNKAPLQVNITPYIGDL